MSLEALKQERRAKQSWHQNKPLKKEKVTEVEQEGIDVADEEMANALLSETAKRKLVHADDPERETKRARR